MADALHDTSWILSGPLVAPADIDVVIAFDDGAVSGFSGCNRFRGQYVVSGEAIEFGPFAGTMMACVEEAMNLERDVLSRLGSTVRASIDAGSLRLLGADDELLLEFTAVTADGLQGDWVVNGIHYPERDAIISARGDLPVTFEPHAISGNAGCNQFHGSCTVTEHALTIGPLMSTRKFCGDDDAGSGPTIMEQEAALLAALQQAVGFRLEGSRLTLTRPDGGISVTLHRA
ncbi:MAG: META domain-containing protein [Actinobacteria bacterium]|nr:META domain-containing protein [Actinomycetota bacterium]